MCSAKTALVSTTSQARPKRWPPSAAGTPKKWLTIRYYAESIIFANRSFIRRPPSLGLRRDQPSRPLPQVVCRADSENRARPRASDLASADTSSRQRWGRTPVERHYTDRSRTEGRLSGMSIGATAKPQAGENPRLEKFSVQQIACSLSDHLGPQLVASKTSCTSRISG